jgi:predicted kinase
MSAKLILIRGLPGSGKSSIAKSLTDYVHIEADQFFTDDDGVYRYDPTQIPEAHAWCHRKVKQALKKGCQVAVSNTFSRVWEMQIYLDMSKEMGINFQIIEAQGCWPNEHGVPNESIEKMRQRWEPTPESLFKE